MYVSVCDSLCIALALLNFTMWSHFSPSARIKAVHHHCQFGHLYNQYLFCLCGVFVPLWLFQGGYGTTQRSVGHRQQSGQQVSALCSQKPPECCRSNSCLQGEPLQVCLVCEPVVTTGSVLPPPSLARHWTAWRYSALETPQTVRWKHFMLAASVGG